MKEEHSERVGEYLNESYPFEVGNDDEFIFLDSLKVGENYEKLSSKFYFFLIFGSFLPYLFRRME